MAAADPAVPAPSRLLVGWSSVDITPELPAQLGGQHHVRVSERVRDPLMATALAIQDASGDHVVVVSCDLLNVTRTIQEGVRARLAGRLAGFDPQKLFLAATHTHTAPNTRPNRYPPAPEGVTQFHAYIDLLTARVAGAIEQAWQRLAPASVGWALAHAAVGYNRRVVYQDGSAQMYGPTAVPGFRSLEGAQDHAVELLFTWDQDRDLTGIVVNLACPSQVVEAKRFISADYWSAVRTEVEARYGAYVSVLPLLSAAGDQSPRDLVRRGRGEPDFRDEEGLAEIGRRLAWAIEDGYERAWSQRRDRLSLGHVVESVDLPARHITAQEAARLRAAYDDLLGQRPEPGSGGVGLLRRLERALRRYEEQGDEPIYPIELHAVRVGDTALVTNPFELFLDYGYRIKARSPAKQTLISQLTCDMGYYLPTEAAVQSTGYGADVTECLVGPEGGDVLVERTVAMLQGLYSSRA